MIAYKYNQAGIASSIGKTNEALNDSSALHCPVSNDWVFNANYAAKAGFPLTRFWAARPG